MLQSKIGDFVKTVGIKSNLFQSPFPVLSKYLDNATKVSVW
jgi:hypothetical protein